MGGGERKKGEVEKGIQRVADIARQTETKRRTQKTDGIVKEDKLRKNLFQNILKLF